MAALTSRENTISIENVKTWNDAKYRSHNGTKCLFLSDVFVGIAMVMTKTPTQLSFHNVTF